MADAANFPHDGDRSLALVRYLDGDLSPSELAALEAHLPGCEGCRRELALARRLFPAVDQLLAEDLPQRSPDELLALLREAEAKVREERPRRPRLARLRARWPLWTVGGLGLAAAAAALFVLWPRLNLVAPEVGCPKPPRRAPLLAPPRWPVRPLQLLLAVRAAQDSVPTFAPRGQVAVLPHGGTLTATVIPTPAARYLALAVVGPGGRVTLLLDGEAPCVEACRRFDRELPGEAFAAGGGVVVAVEGAGPLKKSALASWLATVKPGSAGVPPAAVGGDHFASAGARAE